MEIDTSCEWSTKWPSAPRFSVAAGFAEKCQKPGTPVIVNDTVQMFVCPSCVLAMTRRGWKVEEAPAGDAAACFG